MVRLPPHQLPQERTTRVTAAARQRPPASSSSRSVAAAATSLTAKRPLIYWQAVGGPALLFRGPLGNAVGEAPAGSVIREVRRYKDPFGSWWAASRVEDGTTVWVLLSVNDATNGDGETACWQRVYDERFLTEAPESSDHPKETGPERELISTEKNTRTLPPLDTLLRDIQLLEECWQNVAATPGTGRNWNEEYQQLVEMVLFGVWEKSVATREKLRMFMGEFARAAEDAAFTLLADLLRPSSEREARATKCGTMGTFQHNNLLVRLVLDDGDGNCKGDVHAWQVASQSMQAVQLVALEGPKRLLSTPPTALVTFTGFRLIVTAIPPVAVSGVVYLPLQELERRLDPPEFVKSQMMDLGQSMGLQLHNMILPTRDALPVTLPVDVAVVVGHDKRLYIMNASRVLPHIATVASGAPGTEKAAGLRFRPEFLLSWGRLLSPDAFVENAATPEDNAAVVEATECLHAELIPAVAEMLDFHRAVDVPRQDNAECTLCSLTMENELRFVVCRGDDMCCNICSHCYTKRLSEEKKHSNLFGDAVKCGSTPRGPKGLLVEPSLTSIFHANGLNMRFLPFVYHRISEASRFAVGHYLEIEMIARAAVRVLRDKLRRTAQTIGDVKTICQDFLLGLLQSSGATAERFWAKDLGPALESLYGLQEPFDTVDIDIELLYHRVEQLSGVFLDKASVASFHSEKPFLQIAEVRPLVKTIQPPHVEDEASHSKTRAALLQRLEDVLLFWIGASSKSEESGGKELAQPFYLTERDSWV
ncbi:hypothetical protein DQ04_00091170 [Trypanosoma grayi]|uniref:hypothetical protein n=1 Tax=Trypanosoma grayi TaxID=71804 RepID=UPI0004F432A0|nr:hypothetical protein DQ04_00091170 [Trypanosoma grayi]KEG15383.1 hypothetical protein DQ04_00091170 [Trypanosoma grayi]